MIIVMIVIPITNHDNSNKNSTTFRVGDLAFFWGLELDLRPTPLKPYNPKTLHPKPYNPF